MKKVILSLIFLTIASPAIAATNFVWTQPSTNQDGTPLTDLKGNKIYCGLSKGQYTITKDVGLPAGVGKIATYPIISVLTQQDKYYCAVTAYDFKGNESTKSNEVFDPFNLVGPSNPTEFGTE